MPRVEWFGAGDENELGGHKPPSPPCIQPWASHPEPFNHPPWAFSTMGLSPRTIQPLALFNPGPVPPNHSTPGLFTPNHSS